MNYKNPNDLHSHVVITRKYFVGERTLTIVGERTLTPWLVVQKSQWLQAKSAPEFADRLRTTRNFLKSLELKKGDPPLTAINLDFISFIFLKCLPVLYCALPCVSCFLVFWSIFWMLSGLICECHQTVGMQTLDSLHPIMSISHLCRINIPYINHITMHCNWKSFLVLLPC